MESKYMKTLEEKKPLPDKWLVWTSRWLGGYAVLLKGNRHQCVGWEYYSSSNVLIKKESKSFSQPWLFPFSGKHPDFKEISEEEAVKILVGGPVYGVSKFSKSNKAYSVPGVS